MRDPKGITDVRFFLQNESDAKMILSSNPYPYFTL